MIASVVRGRKTPRDVEVQFRALYLHTANASEAARRLKLPIQTGAKLARDADADPEFVKACNALLTQALRKADAAASRGLDIIVKALESGPLEDAMGSPIDRRAELQRAVVATRDSFDRTMARREAKLPDVPPDAQVTIAINLKPQAPPVEAAPVIPEESKQT